MGNEYEINLSKYNCSCFQNEDGCLLDFVNEISKKSNSFKLFKKKEISPNISEIQENIPGGINYPNDNMIKIGKKKYKNSREKLNSFQYLEYIDNDTTDNNKINIEKTSDMNNQEQKEKDIKEFDQKTDYFQLAIQINDAINELKMNLLTNEDKKKIKFPPTPTPTPTPGSSIIDIDSNLNFQKIMRKAGKNADKICFNDIIGCVKKISEINSEVTLNKEKIYIGIVNNFKKEKNDKNLINYEDQEKIVELPNFNNIKEKMRNKLGDKFNNAKFKFNKFCLKGSFPNEILIWNLISQNTQEIADILRENYYCCLVLLYYSKVEEENETIMYLINKPT
jgi:hypothetical protein